MHLKKIGFDSHSRVYENRIRGVGVLYHSTRLHWLPLAHSLYASVFHTSYLHPRIFAPKVTHTDDSSTGSAFSTLGTMSETEDLQSNPFFVFLQSKIPLERIADRNFVVCVPAAGSLTKIKLDNQLLLAHLLAPTSTKDVYSTQVAGQLVHVTADAVSTREGFSYHRTVPILAQETFYDDKFRSFQILHLAYPIVGPVSASYVRSLQPQEICPTPLIRRSLGEHAEVLLTVLGSKLMRELNLAMHKFTSEFLQSYLLVKGFEAATNDKISDFSTGLSNEFIKRAPEPNPERCQIQIVPSSAKGSINGWSPMAQTEFRIALDCLIAYELNQFILGALVNFFEVEDSVLTARANALKSFSPAEQHNLLNVRDDLKGCSVAEAVQCLRRMGDLHTPLQKLVCVSDALNCIFASVNDHVKRAKQTRRNAASGTSGSTASPTSLPTSPLAREPSNDPSILANAVAAAAEAAGVGGVEPPVQSHEDTPDNETEAIATDDVLPLLTLAMIQAHSGQSFATLQYIKHFKPKLPLENSAYQQLEAAFASYSAAVIYVLSDKFPLTHGSPAGMGPTRRRGSNAFTASQLAAAAAAAAAASGMSGGAPSGAVTVTPSMTPGGATSSVAPGATSAILSSLGVSPSILDSDDERDTFKVKSEKKSTDAYLYPKRAEPVSSVSQNVKSDFISPSSAWRTPSVFPEPALDVSASRTVRRDSVSRGNASPGSLLSAGLTSLEFEQEQYLVESILGSTSIHPPRAAAPLASAVRPSPLGSATYTGTDASRRPSTYTFTASASSSAVSPPQTLAAAAPSAPQQESSGSKRIDFSEISRKIATTSTSTPRAGTTPSPTPSPTRYNDDDDDDEIAGMKNLLQQLMSGTGNSTVPGRT